ncbi:F0F1 ATP synthase subunit A, partial [Lysobacter sp. 2RAB21]
MTHNTSEVFGSEALSKFNFDSWIVALVLGLVFILWFGLAARKATAGVPSKGQAFVEIILEFIDGQVKDTFHGDRRSVTP